MSVDLLVRGRWIVTGAGADDGCLSDAALAVRDRRIVDLGDWPTLRARFPEAEVLGSERVAVMPGLINAHHHASGTSYLQHGGADGLLEPWILSLTPLRSGDRRLETLISATRLMRGGVTSVLEVSRGEGTAERFDATSRMRMAAYETAGLRAVYAPGRVDHGHLAHGAAGDRDFIASLPEDLRPVARAMLPDEARFDREDYFAVVEGLAADYRENPRVSVGFGPAGPTWVADETWPRIAEEAERLDLLIQTHVVESLYEKLHGPRDYGCSTVEHLHRLGVLSPRFSLAHGVWLNERDIEILAETGAAVSHNPGSNLRLRAGIAPVNAMMAAGVTVALGMDTTTLDDDEDMYAEMRLAMRLHRTPRLDGPAPTPAEIFGLATSGGARLLRREGELGRLAVGYAADLVLLDLDRMTWPWVAPEAEPRDLLLNRAQARDISTVLVGGEVVLRDGQPTRFDLEEVARALTEQLDAQPLDEALAADVARLLPHLVAYYRGWAVPEPAPYTAYNSKT